MSSFFTILKEDEPIEGIDNVLEFLRVNRVKEDKRIESLQVKDSKRVSEEKRQQRIGDSLAKEVKDLVKRVKRKQRILPAYLPHAIKYFQLDEDNKRATSLRKLREMKNKGGLPKNLQEEFNKNWDLWLFGVKQAFGHTNLSSKTVKRIRRYLDNPYAREFNDTTAKKIIELYHDKDSELRRYKSDVNQVNEDYDELITELEIKVNTIKTNEQLAEEAIEKSKLLRLSIRRIEEGWDENNRDNFWNNTTTQNTIKDAFNKMKESIKEYKKQIKIQWKGITNLWEAIRYLRDTDVFRREDYSFRELDQQVTEDYIELSKTKLSEFMASLGDEPNQERLEDEEWKQKVQEILEGEN
jgi:hypothetical protein